MTNGFALRERKPHLLPMLTLPIALLLAFTLLTGCGAAGATRSQAGATNSAINHKISTTKSITYVAIGASDAFGIGTTDPDRQNWPTVLAGNLGRSIHLINLGIPGETVAQAQQNELPVALDSRPQIVTVWLAVNDITDRVPVATYSQQLQSLLATLHQKTHAQIFVGNIPNLTLLPAFANQDTTALLALVQQWNAAIATACDATGAHLVNLFAQWNELANHPEYISSDGLHPSTIGAQRLADVFAANIEPYLKS